MIKEEILYILPSGTNFSSNSDEIKIKITKLMAMYMVINMNAGFLIGLY